MTLKYEDDEMLMKANLYTIAEMTLDNKKAGVLYLNEVLWNKYIHFLDELIETFPLHTAIALDAYSVLDPFMKGALAFCSDSSKKSPAQLGIKKKL